MATQILNTLSFPGVAAGASAAVPHGLNFDGKAVIPDTVDVPDGFDFVSANATDVTVQNVGGATASATVLVEAWHTFLRAFGPKSVTTLSPQPYVRKFGSGGGGAAAATFVYQPGGTAGGNVFTGWPALMTALDSVRGIRYLEFDDSFSSPATIPAGGPYSMKGVVWKARDYAQFTAVDIADGASFANLRAVVGQLTVRNLNTVTPPITDLAAFDNIWLDDSANIECGVGAVPFVDFTGLGGGAFLVLFIDNQASFGLNPGGGVPVFDVNVVGATLFVTMGNGGPQRNSISGVAGSALFLQLASNHAVFGPQPAFLGSTTIFVTNTGPQRNIVPGPGSTPFVAPTGIVPGDVALADVSGGAFALTLQTLPGGSFNSQGIPVEVKETSGSVGLTVAPGGANTIDGVAAAIAVPAGGAVRLISDGVSNWIVVS